MKLTFTSVNWLFCAIVLRKGNFLFAWLSCSPEEKDERKNDNLNLNKISDEAGTPPEFKHIIKGRKRK